ncbi:transporter substrate-binding domain-containing protein [Roseomonas frigidaquae]|uniref:Transporter substrate-binding domain-containing protein n=1 Tax=Falsiroseomonas frigidaquae TaxID=487318 RepID=A0ABX1F7C8_9PROT|nr:transporter substrate-binding domain-containing protein [Falsiroseomonas frigidaquae]NKE48252.1 transporter substrate-binding domain-containing protein [Falsiroseomonas frigidaquae]
MRPMLILGLTASLLAGLAALPAAAQSTLEQVRARGELLCATNTGLAGFAQADAQGVVRGLDADTCRAIAAAALGDANKVRFLGMTTPQAIAALREGRVDVASRNLTQTMGRDTDLGLSPAGINFNDGQGFLVPAAARITEAKGLDGKRICVVAGTSNAQAQSDAARRLGIRTTPVESPGFAGLRDDYAAGRCDAISADLSSLLVLRQTGTADPAAHLLLPDIISREPLGPLVRDGDPHWRSLVFWVVNVMLEGEARDIGTANAAARRADPSPLVRRILGAEPGLGTPLGLSDDWAFQVLRQVGNYGEVFERNLGQGSSLKLERGLNALWNRGGLMYPIPMR